MLYYTLPLAAAIDNAVEHEVTSPTSVAACRFVRESAWRKLRSGRLVAAAVGAAVGRCVCLTDCTPAAQIVHLEDERLSGQAASLVGVMPYKQRHRVCQLAET